MMRARDRTQSLEVAPRACALPFLSAQALSSLRSRMLLTNTKEAGESLSLPPVGGRLGCHIVEAVPGIHMAGTYLCTVYLSTLGPCLVRGTSLLESCNHLSRHVWIDVFADVLSSRLSYD